MTCIQAVITHVREAGFTVDLQGTMNGNPERTEFTLSVPAGEQARCREWFLAVSRSAVPIGDEGLHFAELACSPWPLVEGEQITISYADYFEARLERQCSYAKNRIWVMTNELQARTSWRLAPEQVSRWLRQSADQPGTGA
ncbi:hypothetical protein VQ574_20910 (plasmid) [Stutzerimonas frequens]|uniref:hypothetical protein n=1 Tax=Stutzerimonas frequens TaxID=2968969 RepID=UPI002DBEE480|nr:hypothetical protein [Stutzerimonas frequens]WRW29401.1 hypothetical protein VQ574_20910 [Stutzerimonas frequens]